MSPRTVWLLSVALVVATGAFALFAYNSGFGYDAVEYLVLGRGLTEGVPLYTYLPSKAPGIYWVVAFLYGHGVSFSHPTLAAVVAALFALSVVGTYAVVRGVGLSLGVSVAAAVATAACATFMEMNFLEPTQFFYLAGLAAFYCVVRHDADGRRWRLLLAGLAIGIGVLFKASALFYGLGAAVYLTVAAVRDRRGIAALIADGAVLAFGSASLVAIAWADYAANGHGRDFWRWTFEFPLRDYPAQFIFLSKVYTKLLWVHLAILGALGLLAVRSVRERVLANAAALAALIFGACAYLAALKSQASHYFFPGAPFLLLFAIVTYTEALKLVEGAGARQLRTAAAAIAGLAALAVASGILYRPDAAVRLVTVRNFAPDEDRLRDLVQSRVSPQQFVLFTGGGAGTTYGYWISHRYPPPPLINADVKTIWLLRHEPQAVFSALNEPRLALVQFEPSEVDRPQLEDVFGAQPGDQAVMRRYLSNVESRFQPLLTDPNIGTLWIPRTRDARDEHDIPIRRGDT